MRPPRRCLLFLLAAVLCSACGRAPDTYTLLGETQGTTYQVKVVLTAGGAGPEGSGRIAEVVGARLADVDKKLSTYRPDSELSRFNAHADTTPFKVSPELLEVLEIARRVSEMSGGAFDLTVAPLVAAWGFGPGGRQQRQPAENELTALRERVGYRHIEIDRAASTLRKTRPDVVCDVNGVAQGYTVDKLAADLDALGFANYMVEVGGEVKVRGHNANGAPWRIGIEKPTPGVRAIGKVVPLTNRALSTSGDYRDFYEQAGVRVSHTVDPRTGRPVTHALASASVIHQSCAMADALCTALMVLGPEEGLDFALKHNLAARFVIHDGADGFFDKTTPAFDTIAGGAAEGRG